MHSDHDDGGSRLRKRSDEAYVVDPPRPSTFLEGDFNLVMDDQCQFHRDAKNTMRECEQLKRALGVPSECKKAKSDNNDDQKTNRRYDNRNRNLINAITMTADPIVATTTGINVIIATTTVAMIIAMTDVTPIVAPIAMKTTTTIGGMTVATISAMIATTTGVMIVVARTTITTTTITARSALHHRRQKGATPMVCSKPPTEKSTSLSAVAKQPKAIGSFDQTQGRSGTSTLKLHNPCIGRISQLLSLGKIHIPDPGTYPLVVNPIVDGAFLPKTLIDGGSSLNIIFT
jgi:uncharacterized membrane protein